MESWYRKACDNEDFKQSAHLEAEAIPEEEAEETNPNGPSANNEEQGGNCEDFLKAMAGHNDATLVFNDNAPVPQEPVSDLQDLPDQEELENLLRGGDGAETEEPIPPAHLRQLPRNLREAMDLPGCMFNALMRLSIYLRCAPGGCDLQFVPNPLNCRKAGRKLSWYQRLGNIADSYGFCCSWMGEVRAV